MFASFEAPRQEMTGASLKVALYGPDHPLPPQLYMLRPAHRKETTFRRLVSVGGDLQGDGIVLEHAGASIGLPVRDCAAVCIYHTERVLSMLLHCGRDQLAPGKEQLHYGSTGKTILTSALYHWRHNLGCSPNYTRAVIVRGICAEHFPHNEGRRIRPFVKFYGDTVFRHKERGELDLEKVVRRQLALAQIGAAQIDTIGTCTFEEPLLGSRRRDGTSPEAVARQNVVVMDWS